MLPPRFDQHLYALPGRVGRERVDIGNLVDMSVPTVNITNPADGATVAGKVNVTASLNDDAGLAQVFFKISHGILLST
mgnify:CR=1 FL=1